MLIDGMEATGRDHTEIEPPSNTNWGNWGPTEFCEVGSFARDFQLKVQNPQGSGIPGHDDSALNAIKLYCYKYNDGKEEYTGSVISWEGEWGDWNEVQKCDDNGSFLNGVQFLSEPHDSDKKFDDTAGNNLNFECNDGKLIYGKGGSWGTWSTLVKCPADSAICGLQTMVEPWQGGGKHEDDTSLNRVKFFCCKE